MKTCALFACRAITNAIVKGSTAMSLTGHKNTDTFRNYRVLVEEAKRAAIKQRDAALVEIAY